jgi:hypothetical protein
MASGGAPPRQYRVTLHFCELRDNAVDGSFDVLLQGETVLDEVNVSRRAQGRHRPLTRHMTVSVAERLSLELRPRGGAPPMISAMRIEQLPDG